MPKINLIGPSAEWRATEANARRAINWFVHMDEHGGKERLVWVGTPGTALNKALGALARGFHIWDTTAYVVIGTGLYSYDGSTLSASLGTLSTSTGYVSMAHSAKQLAIVDGSAHIYVWDGTTFTDVDSFSTYVTLDSTSTAIVADRAVATEDSGTVVVASNIATVTCSADHLAYPGELVTLSGHGTSALNGAKTVLTTPTSTTFTFAVTLADNTYDDADYLATFDTVTITCLNDHNAAVGDTVVTAGHTESDLNGEWTVNAVPTTTTLSFNLRVAKASATYAATTATAAILTETLPITPSRVTFMDAFFIVNNTTQNIADGITTQQAYYCVMDDARVWTATRFLEPQRDPDAMLTPYADHGNLLLFGALSAESWFNPGTSEIDPFEPARSAAIPWGIAAPWTVARLEAGVVWVGTKVNSSPCVVRLEGFGAKKISTPPVEKALKDNTASLATATAYSYVDEGHEFYVLNIGTVTWVFDASTELWHERQSWAGSAWGRHRGQWYGYFGGKHLVTDYEAGNLLEMSLGTYTDYVTSAAHSIRRLGRSGFVGDGDTQQAHRRLHLDLAHPATSAFVTLKWSDDGGHTWTQGETQSVRGYDKVVEFWRLAASQNRVYEVTTEMQAQSTIIGAWVDTGGESA